MYGNYTCVTIATIRCAVYIYIFTEATVHRQRKNGIIFKIWPTDKHTNHKNYVEFHSFTIYRRLIVYDAAFAINRTVLRHGRYTQIILLWCVMKKHKIFLIFYSVFTQSVQLQAAVERQRTDQKNNISNHRDTAYR